MYQRSRLTAHQSKKFATHRQIKVYFFGFLAIVAVFAFVFLLSKITYINSFKIKDFVINGVGEEVALPIRKQVGEILNGSYLGLFSKANTFLYPHDSLVANIQSSLPQIQSLKISRNGLSGLKIDIVPKNPSATVCTSLPEFGDDHSLKIGDNCYLVDWSGQIFATGGLASGNIYFIPSIAENMTNDSSLILSYVASTSEFVALQNFYEGARDVELKPRFILVKENGEYEMFADDVIIYFNNLRRIEEQLNNLVSFWKNSKYSKSDLEYIDVRYGSSVFYWVK